MSFAPGTFHPSAGYSFPRSYVNNFQIQRLGGSLVQNNNFWILSAPPPNPATFHIEMDLAFFAWSSNGRSMDHIITESFYRPNGNLPPVLDMPFILDLNFSPPGEVTLRFAPFGLYGDPITYALHPAPRNYWLGRPYP